MQFQEVEALGSSKSKHVTPTPSTLASICYTSGTTGLPKGVVLTHQNFVSSLAAQVSAFLGPYAIRTDAIYFSYLSLALPFEKVLLLLAIYGGAKIGLSNGNINMIYDEMKILKPTYISSVPRVWNNVYQKINHVIDQSGTLKKNLFRYAYEGKKKALQKGSLATSIIWDKLIFTNIQEIFGGKIRFMISHSEPLSPEVLEFIRICFRCNVLESYGSTELTGFSTLTFTGDYNGSRVGPPMSCNEIKLVDVPEIDFYATDKPNPRGEICIRGPNVFKEYVPNQEMTRMQFDQEGWLHTGDLGMWLACRSLQYLGRKSLAFKLEGDVVVQVDQLERLYSKSLFVSYIYIPDVLLKENGQVSAIVHPNNTNLLDWAKSKQIQGDISALCQNQQVQDAILNDLCRIAAKEGLTDAEKIHFLYLEPVSFLSKNSLTSTFRVNRTKAWKEYSFLFTQSE